MLVMQWLRALATTNAEAKMNATLDIDPSQLFEFTNAVLLHLLDIDNLNLNF